MNIYKCSGQRSGLKCVYRKIEINEQTGELEEGKCSICQHDTYNIYPEFDESTGEVIYQSPLVKSDDGSILRSTEVDPVGRLVIWENITNQHQDGNSFDYREFRADIHPLYHMVEYNVPTKYGELDPDTVASVFGNNKISMSSMGWHEDKSYGFPNKENCKYLLLGVYDVASGKTIHRSMKDYSGDILDWIDFSVFQKVTRPRKLYLLDASDEIISSYVKEKFEDEKAAKRMIEIMQASRDGEFINIKQAAVNNGISPELANEMLNEISFKSKASIYKGSINLQKLYELYENINSIVKEPEHLTIYRVNILNYVLNYPNIQDILFDKEYFGTNERYWFVYLMLKKAYKRDKIIDPSKLPYWIVCVLHEVKNGTKKFKLFNEECDTQRCTEEEFDVFVEAFSNGIRQPDRLFPAMDTIENTIGDDYRTSSEEKKKTFNKILLAGVKWNKTEVQAVWNKFSKEFDKNNPRRFWNFISELDDLDYDQLIERIDGDGNPGTKKACFSNLVEARTIFKDEDNWEVEIPYLCKGITAGAKHKAKFKSRKNMFWYMLMKVGGLSEDNQIDENLISDDKVEMLIEVDQRKDEFLEALYSPDDEEVIDTDEFDGFSEVDLKTGEIKPMVIRGKTDDLLSEWE